MARDPREQQRSDAERIPDDGPGRPDADMERLEDVGLDEADDDLDFDDEDVEDEDEEVDDGEDLEEV
jgi:hypothetical protein